MLFGIFNKNNKLVQQIEGLKKNLEFTTNELHKRDSELIDKNNNLKSLEEKTLKLSQENKNKDIQLKEFEAFINNLNKSKEDIRNIVENSSAGIEETTASLEEINSGVQEIKEQMNISSQNTKKTVTIVEKSSSSVIILDKNVKELVENGTQILKISELINNIANQTNMLALNASIESARAGEYGRGFGVIATEIRKLSEEVTINNKKIKTYIDKIHQDISNIESVKEIIIKSTEDLKKDTDKRTEYIQSINENIKQSAEVLNQITQVVQDHANDIQNLASLMEK